MVSCRVCLGSGSLHCLLTLLFSLLTLTVGPRGRGGLSLLLSPLTGLVLGPDRLPRTLLLLLLHGLQVGRGELLVCTDAALAFLGVRLE